MHQTFVILLRSGPQENARSKADCSAKKVAGLWFKGVGVGAGNFWGVQRIFCQNLPAKLLRQTFYNFFVGVIFSSTMLPQI